MRRVFLHVPKTGGTFVRQAIVALDLPVCLTGPPWDGHQDYAAACEQFGVEGVEYFTVVRHPVAWYRSFWRERMRSGWGGNWPIGHPPFVADRFDEFVRNVCRDCPGFLSELYARYAAPGVVVFRTAGLSASLARYLDDPRILTLPRANASEGECRYTHETRRLILAGEAGAMRLWGRAGG